MQSKVSPYDVCVVFEKKKRFFFQQCLKKKTRLKKTEHDLFFFKKTLCVCRVGGGTRNTAQDR